MFALFLNVFVVIVITSMILAGLALAVGLLLILIVSFSKDPPLPREPRPQAAFVRRQLEAVGPTDYERYSQIAREAFRFSTQPYVVVHEEVHALAEGSVLVRTTCDAFGKRRYVETKIRRGAELSSVYCLYENGSSTPSRTANIEIPVTQVDWSSHVEFVHDLLWRGSRICFTDARGLRWDRRLHPQTYMEIHV